MGRVDDVVQARPLIRSRTQPFQRLRCSGPSRSTSIHYHAERAHQGLGNERIERDAVAAKGEVQCRERKELPPGGLNPVVC